MSGSLSQEFRSAFRSIVQVSSLERGLGQVFRREFWPGVRVGSSDWEIGLEISHEYGLGV